MCGIVGYVGGRQAAPLLVDGLRRLEYRGYDSAGIALVQDGLISIYKKQGKVAELEKFLEDKDVHGSLGIAHTRWATHGEPSDKNSHPHESMHGDCVIVHNGVIENYTSLKSRLVKAGYEFRSDTDTEVLANWLEYVYRQAGEKDWSLVLPAALERVEGAYGLALVSSLDPGRLFAAKKGSPLVVGFGEQEFMVASDAAPLVGQMSDIAYLSDGDCAVISMQEGCHIFNDGKELTSTNLQHLDVELDAIEKGGYPFFMEKEIMLQPESMTDSLRGRITADGEVVLGGLSDHHIQEKLQTAKRFIIIGCGTSYYAGMVGMQLMEKYTGVPTTIEDASEFRYRNPVINKETVVFAISQSGETADTLAGIELASQAGALVLGVVNVVGSTIARTTDAGVYLHAGPEIGVASTKAFTSQVAVLSLIALYVSQLRDARVKDEHIKFAQALRGAPEHIQTILGHKDDIFDIAKDFVQAGNFLYLGRGLHYPVALEGALKLTEISYSHASGLSAAAMKHGPIALIDEEMPVVCIAPHDDLYQKVLTNVREVKARGGRLIAVVSPGDSDIRDLAEYAIEVPEGLHVDVLPLLTVVPLQLLAYYIASLRGLNVDQPRNLAKAVTVE